VFKIFNHFAALGAAEHGIATCAFDNRTCSIANADAGQPIRDSTRLRHIVGNEHDAVAFFQAKDQIFDGLGGFRIKGTRRFIHQDDLGANREGSGEAKSLLLSHGK